MVKRVNGGGFIMENVLFASTCALSKLPIKKGDDVHFMFLSPNRGRQSPTVFTPHSLYKPVGFPIKGQYNGSGGLILLDDEEGNFFRKAFAEQFGIPLEVLLAYVVSDKTVFDKESPIATYLFGDTLCKKLDKKELSSLLALGFEKKNSSYTYKDQSVYIKVFPEENRSTFEGATLLVNGILYPHSVCTLSEFVEELYYGLNYILGVEECYLASFRFLESLTGMFVLSPFVDNTNLPSKLVDFLHDAEEDYVSEVVEWLKRVKHYRHKYGEDEVHMAHTKGVTFYRELMSQSTELSKLLKFLFPEEYVWELPFLLENPFHFIQSLKCCLTMRVLFEGHGELFSPQLSTHSFLLDVSQTEFFEERHQGTLLLFTGDGLK